MAIAALMSSATRQRNDWVMIFSPCYLNERYRLPRQREVQLDPAVFTIDPFGRRERRELSGGFEPRVLLRRRILRRPHRFPNRVGVAVITVNAVMLDQRALRRSGRAGDRQANRAVGRGHVVVVIVPGHDRDL